MMMQRSGVILSLTATPGGRSAGSPDLKPFKKAIANDPEKAGSLLRKWKRIPC